MKKFLVYIREYLWRARIKTCLCVFPLRAGLFCLASLNVFISLLQIVGVATGNVSFLPVLAHVQSDALGGEDHSPGACVVPPSAHLAFSSVLLAALFRKDVVLLGLYCCYVLGSIFLSLVVYGLLNAIINSLDIFLITIDTLYQIYIMILVRSLMIEIELETSGEKNTFIYNKDQGVVIIRDVESPPPGFAGQYPALPEPRSPNGLTRHYPAITEPGMNTSITTLETLHERPEYDSRFNTINRNNTLKNNTLRSYTVQEPVDNSQRSVTLPYKGTNVRQDVKMGTVQSLAGPATFKTVGNTYKTPITTADSQVVTVNSDAAKKDDKPTIITTTAVIETNTSKTSKTDDEITKADEQSDQNDDTNKTEEVATKKRGLFRKTTKEVKKVKNVEKEAVKTKPSTSKDDELNKVTDVSNTDLGTQKDGTKTEEATKGIPQKKKRGLFKRADNKDKKGKGDKSEESKELKNKENESKIEKNDA
ncbi:hypothetical protein O0L34_g13604 [Tuta absoluta]|nr:hypothetical protein O0L34_g13604 [Tuta absoluta]